MTRRLTVAAVAGLTLASLLVWTHEAGAFTTAVRLCVKNARNAQKNAIRTSRLKAQSDFATAFRSCFDPSQQTQTCVSTCQTNLDVCQNGNRTNPTDPPTSDSPNGKKAFCTNSDDPNSCLSKFDAAIGSGPTDTGSCSALAPCVSQPPDPVGCANAQLACTQKARLDRFSCQQGCAAQVQPDLDSCGVAFNDCTERCG